MELDESSKNRDIWKVMSKIKKVILRNDGMIFGGFVRDSILHDHYAQLFYAEYAKMNEDQDDILMDLNTRYGDRTFLPETWERTTLPNDIDMYISEDNLENFYKDLKDNRMSIRKVFSRNPRNYMPNFDSNDETILHHRIYVRPDLKPVFNELSKFPVDMTAVATALINVHTPKIKIDIISSRGKVTEPFFGVIDFECNALYLTKHGINVSERLCFDSNDFLEKSRVMTRVIDEIIKKRTQFINPVNFRAAKLFNRGWCLYDEFITTIKDSAYEGHCIICHDELPEHHVKAQCCDCRFHPHCLVDNIMISNTNNNCIMCKTACYLRPKHVALLENIHQPMNI
jgi:hypothetical protein